MEDPLANECITTSDEAYWLSHSTLYYGAASNSIQTPISPCTSARDKNDSVCVLMPCDQRSS